jgi:hypothetical protein
MPTLRRRADVIWIAAALTAGAGGAVIADAASSSSARAPADAGALQVTAAKDPALASTDPSDAEAAAKLAVTAGVRAAPGSGPQTWRVGGRTVLGYTAGDGSFCFAFAGGAAGCLQPGTLSDQSPLDITTDYGPGTFSAYGLALDGVVAVEIRIGHASRAAAFGHNSFTFSDASLGGTERISGEAIATMADGTARAVPFRVGPLDTTPVGLP